MSRCPHPSTWTPPLLQTTSTPTRSSASPNLPQPPKSKQHTRSSRCSSTPVSPPPNSASPHPLHAFPPKQLALTPLPTDKVAEPSRPAAHIAFQTLAHAYALLSSPHLRTRYDTTGNTSVSSSTDFNWSDFYQTQYADLVTPSAITTFAAKYKHSPEERQDVLTAYTKYAGNLGKLYESVVLSNPLEDEDRFREYIDDAINTGKVQRYKAYDAETDRQKENRMKKARKELKRFETANLKPTDKNADPTPLQALIQNRHRPAAAASFLENLEAKYASGSAGKKRKAAPEPPEAAFAATATRARKKRAPSVEEEAAGGKDGEDEDEEWEEEEAERRKEKGKRKAAARKGGGRTKKPKLRE